MIKATNITTSTTTEILSAADIGSTDEGIAVTAINIYNTDSSDSAELAIELYDTTNSYTLAKTTLSPEDTYILSDIEKLLIQQTGATWSLRLVSTITSGSLDVIVSYMSGVNG